VEKKKVLEKSYNDRLFKSGIRKKLHMGRYEWLIQQIEKYDCHKDTMLELGCFDAKTLDFLPQKPNYYRGYDANWENGLDIGRKKWAGHSNIDLFECQNADEMEVGKSSFDISVCLETMEHINDE